MKNILDVISFEILSSRGNPPGHNRKFIQTELLSKISSDFHRKMYARLLVSVSSQIEPSLFNVTTNIKL